MRSLAALAAAPSLLLWAPAAAERSKDQLEDRATGGIAAFRAAGGARVVVSLEQSAELLAPFALRCLHQFTVPLLLNQ